MKKKILIVFLLFVITVGVKAALPALAVLPAVVDFVGGLVVRQAGKEAIVSLGVAANDGTFAAAAAGWGSKVAAFLGIGLALSPEGLEVDQFQVPVTGLSVPGAVSDFGELGTAGNEIPFGHPGLGYKVFRSGGGDQFFKLDALQADDATERRFDAYSTVVVRSDQLIAALAEMEAHYTGAQTGCGVFKVFTSPPAGCGDSIFGTMPLENGKLAWAGNFRASNGLFRAVPVMTEPKDGSRRFKWTEDGYVADPLDPDWSLEELQQVGIQKHLQFNGNVSGQQVRMDAVRTASGFEAHTLTQVNNDVVHRAMSVDSSGLPRAMSDTLLQGVVVPDAYQTYPQQSPTPNTGAAEAPVVNLQTCGTASAGPCSIDDSGFSVAVPGAPAEDITSGTDSLVTQVEQVQGITGYSWEWLPDFLPGAYVACRPLSYSISGVSFRSLELSDAPIEFDLCPAFDLIRNVLGFIFGFSAVFVVWREFFNSNRGV